MKNFPSRVAILASFLLSLAACQNGPTPLTIGAIYNLTGGQQTLDIPASQGARVAIEEINSKNGVLGGKVRFLLEDGKTDVKRIRLLAEEMIAANGTMPALIGMSDTDVVLAAARVAAKYERLFITSGATSPLLPKQVPTYLFLACYGDNVQAAAAADWAFHDLKARNVAVLYKRNMSYTELLRRYFEEAFADAGGEISFSEPYTDGTQAAVVRDVPIEEVDLVYFSASPDEVVRGVSLLREAGYAGPIASGDGFDIGEGWQNLPTETDSYFTTHADVGPDNTDPRIIAFRKAYSEKYPGQEPDAFSALGYDTVKLLVAAVEKAGSTDPGAVRAALAGLTGFQGLTGSISYRNGSRIPEKPVALFRVRDGREAFVKEILPNRVPAP